jgi:hypothetical protein
MKGNVKHIIRNVEVKGLPYKNHAGKEVSPRKTGPDCGFMSFQNFMEPFYSL